MPVNINTQIYECLPENFALVQRAFLYSDALFESIRVADGGILLLERHWSRLSLGLIALGYRLPMHWNASFFRQEILRTSPSNARIRLTVWRSPGGLYQPLGDSPQFLITAQPLSSAVYEWPVTGLTLGLAEKVRLPVDAFSNFKTLNAARYVAASLEAKDKGWDEALLLNTSERLCEATSGNLFWWESDLLCTVPLSEGCVAGVFREFLLGIATAGGFAVQEKPVTFAALRGADEVFLTNAIRGILPVGHFAGRMLSSIKTKRLFESMLEVCRKY